jgi:hypothetical protein
MKISNLPKNSRTVKVELDYTDFVYKSVPVYNFQDTSLVTDFIKIGDAGENVVSGFFEVTENFTNAQQDEYSFDLIFQDNAGVDVFFNSGFYSAELSPSLTSKTEFLLEENYDSTKLLFQNHLGVFVRAAINLGSDSFSPSDFINLIQGKARLFFNLETFIDYSENSFKTEDEVINFFNINKGFNFTLPQSFSTVEIIKSSGRRVAIPHFNFSCYENPTVNYSVISGNSNNIEINDPLSSFPSNVAANTLLGEDNSIEDNGFLLEVKADTNANVGDTFSVEFEGSACGTSDTTVVNFQVIAEPDLIDINLLQEEDINSQDELVISDPFSASLVFQVHVDRRFCYDNINIDVSNSNLPQGVTLGSTFPILQSKFDPNDYFIDFLVNENQTIPGDTGSITFEATGCNETVSLTVPVVVQSGYYYS